MPGRFVCFRTIALHKFKHQLNTKTYLKEAFSKLICSYEIAIIGFLCSKKLPISENLRIYYGDLFGITWL